MVSYPKIFRQAWAITKTYKFLWLFGLFLVWTDVLNFQTGGKQLDLPKDLSPVLAVGIFILLIILIVLYFRCRAAIISAVKAVLDKKETTFSKAFRSSRDFYQRLFLISFLIGLAMMTVVLVVAVPVSYFFSLKMTVRAIVLLVLGSGAVIPVLVAGVLVDFLASLFVVLFDLKIKDAVNSSFDLISKHWPQFLVFGFFLFCLTIPALFFGAFVVSLASSLLGIWGLSAGIVFFLFAQSILAVFTQASWVLFFLQLVKPTKLDEEEAALPEAEVVR